MLPQYYVMTMVGSFYYNVCNYYTYPLIIVNVYAPTSDKRPEQVTFGNFIINKLLNFIGHNITLGADLNICLDNLRNSISTNNPSYGDNLVQMLETLDLIDN